jgi:hypothetical protein
MGYIESNLLSDENIVYKAKLHSIILWKACALIFLGIVFLIIQPIVAAIVIAARDIGLVVGNQSGQFCLSIANANLKRGQDVTLVWLPIAEEKQVPELRSATVQKALMNPCDLINSIPGDVAYVVDGGELETSKVYIAIVEKSANSRIIHGRGEVKVESLGDVTFRSCSSIEGLHFTAWSGGGRNEKKIWHRYFYLGYDVEPTCKDPSFKD